MNYTAKAPKHCLLGGGLTLFLLFVLIGHASAGTYIWREAEDSDTSVNTGPNRDWCATDTADPGGDWSQNSHLVFGNGETTYNINFPVAGTYHLWLRYALKDFLSGLRPTDIYLDGGLVLANGTNTLTGGWCGRHAIWEEQSTLTIATAGIHTVRLDSVSPCCWAHIDTILLTTDGAFTPPDMWSSGGGFSNADDPPVGIDGAISFINGLGLDPSTTATLVQKLQEAQDKFDLGDLPDARSKVCDFVGELEAAVDAGSLSTADANLLLKQAGTILGEIEFP